jgi:hypothetical protein
MAVAVAVVVVAQVLCRLVREKGLRVLKREGAAEAVVRLLLRVVVVEEAVVLVEEASLTSHLETSLTTMIWMTLVMPALQLHQSPRRLHRS